MSQQAAAVDSTPSSELAELTRHLDDVRDGSAAALATLRTGLHRVVGGASYSGAVKTLVVQALLLLDDPRVAKRDKGAPLLAKIRKLVDAAAAAHATGGAMPPRAHELLRAEFMPNALVSPDIEAGLVEEFVIEARAQLEIAEASLLALDADPGDAQAVASLFRALHTIKGTSAFFGVEHATNLAHHAETLLARVRSGDAACTGELSNLLFRCIDMLDAMLVALESAADGAVAMLPDGFHALIDALRAGPDAGDAKQHHPRVSGPVRRVRGLETNVRVRSEDLDRLAGIVREFVATHSMIARDASLRAASTPELERKLAHARQLVDELEQVSNELRTVTLAATMQRLTRTARDVAHQSGKSVELRTVGDDLLIERATAEALGDALLQMVRNAIVHGIELPDDRTRAGKPAVGMLRIAATRRDGELVMQIEDDGRGLDAARLTRIAIERGVIPPATRLAEHDAFALILRPGFSTSGEVTDLAGRGVGMDIVRANVEALGGTIAIASSKGRGTAFTIRLPNRGQTPAASLPAWSDLSSRLGLNA